MTTVKNELGTGNDIDFEAAVNLMDDDVREDAHMDCLAIDADNPEQVFFNHYCELHEIRFGTEFEPNKANGQW